MTQTTDTHLVTSDNLTSTDTPSSAAQQPLLHATGLTVSLGPNAGLNNVSLTLSRGDIVGLLGLNGAGKSTTLRTLCGILVPDQGSVVINGYAMSEYPLKARAHIGYLPDQPPLYDDMRVTEYLTLAGQIRGLRGQTLNNRLQTVIEQCALGDVQKTLNAHLSKGYRQRVGLAQALIHEPSVILLDEPSSGLDPQQVQGMRTLIHDLAQHQAIVFSTHLLPEVKTTCNRVAIIHGGQLVADRPSTDDDLDSLFQRLTT